MSDIPGTIILNSIMALPTIQKFLEEEVKVPIVTSPEACVLPGLR